MGLKSLYENKQFSPPHLKPISPQPVLRTSQRATRTPYLATRNPYPATRNTQPAPVCHRFNLFNPKSAIPNPKSKDPYLATRTPQLARFSLTESPFSMLKVSIRENCYECLSYQH